MSEKVGIQGHTAAISFDGKPTEKELAYSKGFRDGLEHAAKIVFARELCNNPEYVAEQIRREVK